MKTLTVLMLVVFAFGGLTGCAKFGTTPEQTQAMLEAYKGFVNQQRMGNVIHVKGSETTPAKVDITGLEVTVATPLPPLEVMPKEGDRMYDTLMHAATEACRFGMFFLGADVVKDAIGPVNSNNTTTAAP